MSSSKSDNFYTLYGDKINSYGDSILAYSPWSFSLFQEQYTIQGKIYEQTLSPSVIYHGTDNRNNIKVAIKELKKSKLIQTCQHEFAKNEMALHYSFSRISDNITKVPAYFENEEAYYIIMEYSEDSNYFEDLLENVKIWIYKLALLSCF